MQSDKSEKRLAIYDSGEQVLITDHPLARMSINIEGAKLVQEFIIEATEEQFKELELKVKTNEIDIDTISGEISVIANETMKEKTQPNKLDIKNKDVI